MKLSDITTEKGIKIKDCIYAGLNGIQPLKELGFRVYPQVVNDIKEAYIVIMYRNVTKMDKLFGDGYLVMYTYELHLGFNLNKSKKSASGRTLVGEDLAMYLSAILLDFAEDDSIFTDDLQVVGYNSEGLSTFEIPRENGTDMYGMIVPLYITVKIYGGK